MLGHGHSGHLSPDFPSRCETDVRDDRACRRSLRDPAWKGIQISFYIAHELAHAALGHLRDGLAIVDLEDPLEEAAETDEEELAADRYALELLTGQPDPIVTTRARRFTAPQLAANLLQTGAAMRIEPGTLALCFGYSTGQWAKANAAMKRIYADALPAWAEINRTAHQQLDWSAISDDLASFVRAVMGPIDDAHSRH